MRERPILFSDAMVRAILAGTKTQTRRIVKRSDGERPLDYHTGIRGDDRNPMFWFEDGDAHTMPCPLGEPGDRLWVREAWANTADTLDDCRIQYEDAMGGRGNGPYYRADHDNDNSGLRWRPSIHMPRWASRITLEIEHVRVQLVQAISEEDAMAEGVEPILVDPDGGSAPHVEGFLALWNSLYGPDAWDRNDWVWAVTFRRVQP